jgi:hypothetical protein
VATDVNSVPTVSLCQLGIARSAGCFPSEIGGRLSSDSAPRKRYRATRRVKLIEWDVLSALPSPESNGQLPYEASESSYIMETTTRIVELPDIRFIFPDTESANASTSMKIGGRLIIKCCALQSYLSRFWRGNELHFI